MAQWRSEFSRFFSVAFGVFSTSLDYFQFRFSWYRACSQRNIFNRINTHSRWEESQGPKRRKVEGDQYRQDREQSDSIRFQCSKREKKAALRNTPLIRYSRLCLLVKCTWCQIWFDTPFATPSQPPTQTQALQNLIRYDNQRGNVNEAINLFGCGRYNVHLADISPILHTHTHVHISNWFVGDEPYDCCSVHWIHWEEWRPKNEIKWIQEQSHIHGQME